MTISTEDVAAAMRLAGGSDDGPIPHEFQRELWQIMLDRMKMHCELRQRIRRSAGLPAGNLVTGSFRRPVRNKLRRPRS